MTHLQHYIN